MTEVSVAIGQSGMLERAGEAGGDLSTRVHLGWQLLEFSLQGPSRNLQMPGSFRDVSSAIGEHALDVFPFSLS